ncbi:SpoIIIAC/SpoIIIAD family protein [Candidatus Soleaferrea massiliensis]|uniref:SpoIIIAC/SpoIIIAD family protein n=1 Tax=Candidatus Soleaferrea massiliensis TaxID=1470354 RepID=UPI000590840B|nr:SpoIIIAC/SpoIIIAD family protein [Candidatus Soleaferrea massiliensis]
MNIIMVVGIAIVGVALSLVLKQHKPEFSMLISLGVGAVVLILIVTSFTPILDTIQSLIEDTQMPFEYGAILMKALGICFIAQLASDTCRDAGESAVASKVELAGKIAVILISLPLFEKILSIVGSLVAV